MERGREKDAASRTNRRPLAFRNGLGARTSGLACLLVAGLALLGASPTALALPQRGHTFAFLYGSKGSGSSQFNEPVGVAVEDTSGDLYIADRKNKRVVQLMPVLGEGGALTGESYVRSWMVAASPLSIAVDNSAQAADPQRGDVYVASAHAVYAFTPEGALVGQPIKRFTLAGTAQKAKLEGVVGVAVDDAGRVLVYQEDGVVYGFPNGQSTEPELVVAAGPGGAPGLAVDSFGNLFVGRRAEGGATVVSKLEPATGNVLIPTLGVAGASGVAANTRYTPANEVDELNQAYVAGDRGVSQFAAEAAGIPGPMIEHFPSKAEEEAHGGPILQQTAGIAVDDATGDVFVTDTAADDLAVFDLQGRGAPSLDGLITTSGAPPTVGAIRLIGQVDPQGANTRAYFEYGTASCSSGGCSSGAAADLGGGFGDREAELELQGLAPGVYHFRLVAESELASGADTVRSPERTFTILAQTSGLPDGREWELVSPPNKHGAAVAALSREGGVILAAEAGGALTFVANGAISEELEGNRSFEPQQVLAVRTTEAWSSQDIATPSAKGVGANFGAPEYQFFSPDLSVALVEPYDPEPPLAPAVAAPTPYLRDDRPLAPEPAQRASYAQAESNSAFLAPGFAPLISKLTAPEAPPASASGSFLAATPDMSHIVLQSSTPLTGPASGAGLYEWSQGNTLRPISVLPGDSLPLRWPLATFTRAPTRSPQTATACSGPPTRSARRTSTCVTCPLGKPFNSTRHRKPSPNPPERRSSRPRPATARACSSPTTKTSSPKQAAKHSSN